MTGNEDNCTSHIADDELDIIEDVRNQKVLTDKVNGVENDLKLIDLEDAVDTNLKDVQDSGDKHTELIELNDNVVSDVKDNFEASEATRSKPVIHQPSEKPLCPKHTSTSSSIIKIDCDDCFALLTHQNTSISQIFAAMRDWIPGSQKKMDILVEEILKRHAHIDDMDGLEGNTMLHYACKSASEGVGSSDMAKQLVKDLLDKGANYKLRSRWTDMLPLHFAAYFNCPDILEILLDVSRNADIDARCKEYDQGTALHMAAAGLCYDAAKFLIDRGADPTLINNLYKTPYECIAEGTKHDLRQTTASVAELRNLLKSADSPVRTEVLKDIGASLGEDVVVGGDKTGILRFVGKTDFATGVWCGVELYDRSGKNNGAVAGVTYFKCKPGHGMFAVPSKIIPAEKRRRTSLSSNPADTPKLKVGDRVNVIGYKLGYIRFLGKVRFSGGYWVGVDLDKPYGKNNGTKDGVKYFTCKPQHGVIVPIDKVRKSEAGIRDTFLSPSTTRRLPPSTPIFDTNRTPSTPIFDTNRTPSTPIFDTNRTAVCSSPMRPARTTTTTPLSPSSAGLSSPNIARRKPGGGVVRSSSGSTSSRGTSPSRTQNNDNLYTNKQTMKLQPGMNAFVNGELGTVKYVGRVDFAEGLWVGVHLKNQNGKNDGTVQGRRYFSCKAGFGIMVRPGKVTIHGISANKLIDERDYPA